MENIGKGIDKFIITVVIIIVVVALGLIGSLTNWFGFANSDDDQNQVTIITTKERISEPTKIVINSTFDGQITTSDTTFYYEIIK